MTSKEETYKQLESKAVSYGDLRNIKLVSNEEPLVPVPLSNMLTTKQIGEDMKPITGNVIYVRQEVAKRLGQASLSLAEINPELQLEVVYGYRALSIQKKLFEAFYQSLSVQFSGDDLLEAVHRLIAVPDVAGHPTGAAVDIQITEAGKPLDFGTCIWEFVPDSFTYSPFITNEATQNRQLLRTVMMEVEFAPFDGEWWHFSYGDKEWAKYCNKPNAIYEQVEFNAV